MSDKAVNAIEVALNNINPTDERLIIVPDGEIPTQTKIPVVELNHNFDECDALALIGDVKYIGIASAERFSASNLTNLINILITTNKATVVRIITNPISCKVFYPTPEMGTKYIEGNYEYSYNQSSCNLWINKDKQDGWGVRVIDKTQTNYAGPLTMIQGHPVTNMSHLFHMSPVTTLNLIDWDTSNVTDMQDMFNNCQAISLDINSFNTSNVTNMNGMFAFSRATTLDLSGFNTSNVTVMTAMFLSSYSTSFDLSSFDTSKVTNMNGMFAYSVSPMLNLISFNTSNVTDMDDMFIGSSAGAILVGNSNDLDKYEKTRGYLESMEIFVKIS